MKRITVFTPTFNRAHLLPRLYESLCRQTNQDFTWLVIDDGSIDKTQELVHKWIDERRIEIQYHYKENGGMHTGHNVAFKKIQTDLCVCVDSDDYLLDNSIERILKIFKENNLDNNPLLAGVVGLNITPNGRVIGKKFPKERIICKYHDIGRKFKAIGDKKVIYKSKLIKELPQYPIFESERFVPLYNSIILDEKFDYLCINQELCIVEYQTDGSTINIYQQYFKNPKGFRYSRRIEIIHYKDFYSKFKSSIHLISSNLILKERNLIKESPNKLLSLLAIPFGVVWYLYIYKKRNENRNIKDYID